MSYILDALKRADAERERGAVPGLHARQLTTSANASAPQARMRLWLPSGAFLLLAGVAGAWWFWQSPVDTVRLATPEPGLARPALPLAAAPPAPASTPASLPQLVLVTPPTTTATPPLATPALPAVPARIQAAPVPVPAVPVPTASAIQATPASVPLLAELPEDSRRQIPALTISGAVYSKDPGQRLLLVNGQVVTQGGSAGPDLTLEEIGAKSSIFSFRGIRFRLAH